MRKRQWRAGSWAMPRRRSAAWSLAAVGALWLLRFLFDTGAFSNAGAARWATGQAMAADAPVVLPGGPRNGAGRSAPADDPLPLKAVVLASPSADAADGQRPTNRYPRWTSLLPPLVAIALAFWMKEVMMPLALSILSALLLQYGFTLYGLGEALARLVDTALLEAMTDAGHQSVILFSLLIGGMVGLLRRNGGLAGVVARLTPLARTPRRTQLVAWLLGLLVFFDDYANTLIVGHTMRPLTDRFGITRARLAYIVDSTSAPLAAIGFVTTWVGAEVGHIEDALARTDLQVSGYAAFLASLKYAYYPAMALALVGLSIGLNRDWPAMRRAAVGTRGEAGLDEPQAPRPRLANALLPIGGLIGVALWALYFSGRAALPPDAPQEGFRYWAALIGGADAYQALLWASGAAMLLAVGSSLLSGMRLRTTADSVLDGFKSMMEPLVILVLAWALSDQVQALRTGEYLIGLVPEGLSPAWFPVVLFLLSGVVAFASGSSWGTMALMYPLFLSAVFKAALQAGWSAPEAQELFYHTASVVLAGAVFGDHCSPISDTTILSSLAAGCDHLEHVRTQMPYALLAAGTALFFGTLPAAFLPAWWPFGFALGFAALYLAMRFGAVKNSL